MSKEFYDDLWTNNTFNFSPSKLIRERWILYLLKKTFSRSKKLRFLDLGCGRGSLLRKVAQVFPSAVLFGADYSEMAVKANASEQPEVQFEVLDFEQEEFSKVFPAIDCVVSQEVIEHLSPDVHVQFLKEIYTALVDNGIAIITTPDWESIQGMRLPGESDDAFAHRFESQPNAHLLTQSQLVVLARDVGFHVLWHKTVCPYTRNRKLSNLLAIGLFLLPRFVESMLLDRGLSRGKYQILMLKKDTA